MLSERGRDKDSRLHQGIELGVPNTEESEITNCANRYLLLKNSAETPLISLKSTFYLQVSRLNDAFHSPDRYLFLAILSLYTLFFSQGPSLLYTNVSKNRSSKVNRLWN